MLLVLKGCLKVLNTPYLVYSSLVLQALLFKGGGYSRAASDRAASDRADTVFYFAS